MSGAGAIGDGTFFKVGGNKCKSKNYRKCIVLIGDCDVTSMEIWCHCIHHIKF